MSANDAPLSQPTPGQTTERVQPLSRREMLIAAGVTGTLLSLAGVAVNAVGAHDAVLKEQQNTNPPVHNTDVSNIEAGRTAQYIPEDQLSINILASDPNAGGPNIVPGFTRDISDQTNDAGPVERP